MRLTIRKQLHKQRVELIWQYSQKASRLDARTFALRAVFSNHASQQLRYAYSYTRTGLS